ncbi:MAG TPA: ABC transporter permease [Methanomassiliicoccales archaeon]|nr:ABC transporter permease [Methanomassiliicoccales archaeon]
MSLALLLKDELNGFYRSKVMLALWVGLPAMAVLLYFLVDNIEGMSITFFTGIMVSSIGGLLTSVLIVVNILNEKEKKVYDLFLIRPIRRENLLLAKFGAVFLCVMVASFIAITLAAVLDSATEGYDVQEILSSMKDSLIITVSIMAINCSAGVLIGVFSPSVLVGVLLVLFGSNQLSSMVLLPMITGWGEMWMVGLASIGISALLLFVAALVFRHKEF